MFRFDIFEVDKNYMEIHVCSNKEMINSHGSSAVKPFKQVRGPKCKELKKLLKYRSARMYQIKENKRINKELAMDGNVQNARRLTVLHNIKSEQRCKNRLRLNSIDIEDIV